MQEVTLTLTVAEVNQILEALGQMPYVRVYELIAKMQQQAQAQLTNLEANGAKHSEPAARSLP
jgi:hypothetical protein